MQIIRAEKKNKEEIIEFIKKNWKEDHILVKDKFLFDYMYKDGEDGKLNFILGIEKEKIEAILGFEKYTTEENGDIFLEIWKSVNNSMLGLKCLEYLLDKFKISSCGINLKTIPIYKFLDFKIGKLKHYYLLNDKIEKFNIARIEKKLQNIDCLNIKNGLEGIVIEFKSMEELLEKCNYNNFKKYNFFKSIEYFNKIYFNHPYYKYEVIGIKNNFNEIESLIVLREIKIKESKCLRIIDFLGEETNLINIESWLKNKILKNNYEYVDFYEIGIKDEILLKIGFKEKKENDNNIIPNYFEPFEQRNIEIYYATSCKEKFRMFKGDGDQDRPSISK